jgi:hypothetical protein
MFQEILGALREPVDALFDPSRRVYGPFLLGAVFLAALALVARGVAFRNVARELFEAGRIDGFGFDFEILMLARRAGYAVVEVPVRVEHRAGGSVRASSYLHTLAEVARVNWLRVRGAYPRPRGRND